MIKFLAGLELRRVAAYAAIAALITGALFAADGAYRWDDASSTQIAAPSVHEPAVTETPKPASAAAADTPAQVPASTLQAESKTTEQPSDVPIMAQTSSPDGRALTSRESVPAPTPDGSHGSASTGATSVIPQAAQATPQIAQPPLPPARPALRTPPATQAARERPAPRRPVHTADKPPARAEKSGRKPAEQPNVYWERDSDSQLGFAPQLRKKTCDPLTGQMPMQCYYPRQGRERFPAKPLN